ncbi:Sec-independent protein translocase subunit TatA [Nocardia transvalensis]|uniref:Sec-independent protein translocase subunit TatA n=1 Tax=Nocardia transvalensis TaxID=37333 RepID=UPI0018945D63|nr:Sec-independent protein translocase subunit TatA [Nocardia transvalensis]MBF6331381.1 Sec-independent protein translocase subunit TatA [Nocardia transvalensis]
MGSLSATHWLIIALLVLVLFGAKRLPDAARGLGRSLRIFKSEMSEMHNDGSQATPAKPQEQAPAAELPPAQSANPAPQANPEAHKA